MTNEINDVIDKAIRNKKKPVIVVWNRQTKPKYTKYIESRWGEGGNYALKISEDWYTYRPFVNRWLPTITKRRIPNSPAVPFHSIGYTKITFVTICEDAKTLVTYCKRDNSFKLDSKIINKHKSFFLIIGLKSLPATCKPMNEEQYNFKIFYFKLVENIYVSTRVNHTFYVIAFD